MKLEINPKRFKNIGLTKAGKIILFIFILSSAITFAFFIFPQLSNNSSVEDYIENNLLLSEIVDENETIFEPSAPNEYEIKLLDEWLLKIPKELVETEWMVVVDRSEQREYVFQNRRFIKSYIVSTGSATKYEYDATLPIGVWRVGKKYDYSLGVIYGPRLMYLEIWRGTFFEKTLKALHGTNEPENLGQATSLGCIYHSNEDIIEIFDWIPEGTLVITVE